MAVIQDELTLEKDRRAAQLQENTQIREKLQEAIKVYNTKEQEYQQSMKVYNQKIQDIEKKYRGEIDTKIQNQMNAAKQAKDSYDQTQKNCDELTSQIQGVIAKFDVIKNEISASSKKMEEYKQEVESKQIEIKLLETQIENFNLLSNKKALVQQEIEMERPKLQKQVETLANLKKALETQLNNM